MASCCTMMGNQSIMTADRMTRRTVRPINTTVAARRVGNLTCYPRCTGIPRCVAAMRRIHCVPLGGGLLPAECECREAQSAKGCADKGVPVADVHASLPVLRTTA